MQVLHGGKRKSRKIIGDFNFKVIFIGGFCAASLLP